jgi:hypothetical protein
MRCVRCGTRAKRLRIGRGPDGRLLFDWCDDCLADVLSRALGGGLLADEFDPPRRPEQSESEVRAVGLRTMGLVLALWGLVLDAIGLATWLGLGPAENGFGPTRLSRVQIFSAAGGVLAIAGAWVGLSSVDRATRRRSVSRAIEAVSLGLGLGVLILGIAFHDSKRDPWIVGVVALACLASWAARQWSRPRGARVVS